MLISEPSSLPLPGATSNTSGRRRAWVGYVVALLLYAGIFDLWQAEPVPDHVYLLAILVAAISLLPLALWYARGNPGIPMFELVCLSYGVQYGAAVFLQPNQIVIDSVSYRLSWDATAQVLMLTALGLAAMVGSYYGIQRIPWIRALPRPHLALDPKRYALYMYGSILIGLLLSALQLEDLTPDNSGPLGAIVRLISTQSLVGLTLLAYAVYRDPGGNLRARLLLYASCGSIALLGLATGLLQNAFLPLLLVLAIRWQVRRRLPITLIAAVALAFVMLNSVKADYRAQIWFSGRAFSVQDRLTLWLSDVQNEIAGLASGNSPNTGQSSLQKAANRTDLLHIFALVHETTPGTVPYYGGQTYSYFLVTWIPRFLWPDKPSAEVESRRMAVDYRLLDPNNPSTSIGVGHPAEAYANFGVVGILAIMALEGCFFGLFGALCNDQGNDITRGIYLALMISAPNAIGAEASYLFGGILQNALGSIVLVRLIGLRRERVSDAPRTDRAGSRAGTTSSGGAVEGRSYA